MTETSTLTYSELETEYNDIKQEKRELIDLLEKAADWNWLTVKEYMEENGIIEFPYEEMEHIWERLDFYKRNN